ncbi:MAG: DUF4252 domain-containing protein [Croceitalea sp.]|nr:DUF4252 domain-containing protein [Croceitalea sp.]MBT8237636.1 DUF4252 domain-containing protein [Croceitalea sp.]NNC33272.1 DUF4252 domain-containing protein [Croceitalea sp.]NNL10018.1 DUF4252 domain-containing protein [Croceitalea sp.]NNM18195.1 DUF4252 domain-containing protein [Croceitalea sp.]
MRAIKIIGALLLFTACGGYNSIDNFYEMHKNDDQVTAIRVPQFMIALVGQISPEMQALVGTTKDLRYMQFPSASESQAKFLNDQMNGFTTGNFIEVFRKNDDLKRNVVAIREKKDVVKEILIYNNDNIKGTFLYFNGNFDPAQVRQLAKNNEFQQFSNGLLPQLNLQTPGISTD